MYGCRFIENTVSQLRLVFREAQKGPKGSSGPSGGHSSAITTFVGNDDMFDMDLDDLPTALKSTG